MIVPRNFGKYTTDVILSARVDWSTGDDWQVT